MNLQTLSTDLGAMIADLPGTLTVGSKTFQASFSSITRAERLTMTGDVQEMDFRVCFPVSSLDGDTVPIDGDRVTATPPGQASVACRVAGRIFPQGGVSVILELKIDKRQAFPAVTI
jgi:hypothetical protein